MCQILAIHSEGEITVQCEMLFCTVHSPQELGAMLFVVVAAVAFADDSRGRDSWKGAPPHQCVAGGQCPTRQHG